MKLHLHIIQALLLLLVSLPHLALSTSEAQAQTQPHVRKVTKVAKKTNKRRKVRKSIKRSHKRVKSRRTRKSRARRHYTSVHRRHRAHHGHHHGRRTVVHHRPAYNNYDRHSSRRAISSLVQFELGLSTFVPIEGSIERSVAVGLGYKTGPLGIMFESQFAQNQAATEIKDINAQFRIYLPITNHIEIYPLVAVGQSNLFSERRAGHIDLGIGAQLNFNKHLAIGGRYSARMISNEVDDVPTNGHHLMINAALLF